MSRHQPVANSSYQEGLPAWFTRMAFLRRSGRTATGFDSDLRELAVLVAEMGGFAERQLAEAIEALTRRDNERARANVAADATIDVMQQAIEQRAMDIILQRRPAAEDLRQNNVHGALLDRL